MKKKTHGNTRYRGNKQRGKFIAITTVVPREVARVINAEGMLRDRSVSKVVAEILVSRYFEDSNLKVRKPLV
jgi:hypothetical protein